MSRAKRAFEAYKCLKQKYPNAKSALDYETPFQFLVAVILSAQTTDVQVNKVTPELFHPFDTPERLATAKQKEVEEIIRSIGFFRNKAKSIIKTAQILVSDFSGQVPQKLDQLVKLPGVGRKTANVVLGQAFGIDSGIAVDTHVGRIARRLGLSKQKDPDKVEKDMLKLFPQNVWHEINLIWVLHGRETCTARNPKCSECLLEDICPKVGVKTNNAK